MSNNWNDYDPAPIETFHSEALSKFHELKKEDHSQAEKAFGRKIGTVDGITFNNILAEFKTKIMKEYGISSSATKKEKGVVK